MFILSSWHSLLTKLCFFSFRHDMLHAMLITMCITIFIGIGELELGEINTNSLHILGRYIYSSDCYEPAGQIQATKRRVGRGEPDIMPLLYGLHVPPFGIFCLDWFVPGCPHPLHICHIITVFIPLCAFHIECIVLTHPNLHRNYANSIRSSQSFVQKSKAYRPTISNCMRRSDICKVIGKRPDRDHLYLNSILFLCHPVEMI